MGYSAISFSAGEQPTTAKWNILGSNDSSFNDGTGIGTNAIAAASLSTTAITLAYAQIVASITTASTTIVAATGLTVNATIPAGNRKVKVTVFADSNTNTAAANNTLGIWSGASSAALTTQLATIETSVPAANDFQSTYIVSVTTPAAGSIWYTVGWKTSNNTATLTAATGSPAFILVEAI